jgi:hypothetical protein
MSGSFTIVLGKDVTLTGITGARSCTVSSSASEIDTTTLGGLTHRRFSKGLAEQTIEIECIDAPGCDAGATITIGGPETAAGASYIVTSVAQSEPIDGIITYTVSGTRAPAT